jgi:hypothetical protein
MYITYNINTRKLIRIDDNLIDLGEENLKVIEKDITFEDDISRNMDIYKVNDNEEFYIDDELVAERELNNLRAKREPLLKAFDIYKTNLIVGAISLPENEKQEVITWYDKVLDLDVDAINNPPKSISRYL